MYIASIRGVLSIAQPVLLQSVNKQISYQTDVLPILCVVLIPSTVHPTIYNLMSYIQEYNEQPVYELDLQYSEDSESDTTILQNLYRSYL